MALTFSLAHTDRRDGDFTHPEDTKCQRWELVITKTIPELVESHDTDSLTFTTDFTAYGDECETIKGAIASFKSVLGAYRTAYEHEQDAIRQYNIENDCYELAGCNAIESYQENEVGDLSNCLIEHWIRAFSQNKRTAFNLNELAILGQYVYVLYGTQNLICSLFSQNSIDFNIGDVPMFTDIKDFQIWINTSFNKTNLGN